ncbi:MAG: hypothetical protein IBJ15_00295 [Alphaproteobacteria bacterium]|nr:hypothetical protein [Alphaproteobacteria bacterium]
MSAIRIACGPRDALVRAARVCSAVFGGHAEQIFDLRPATGGARMRSAALRLLVEEGGWSPTALGAALGYAPPRGAHCAVETARNLAIDDASFDARYADARATMRATGIPVPIGGTRLQGAAGGIFAREIGALVRAWAALDPRCPLTDADLRAAGAALLRTRTGATWALIADVTGYASPAGAVQASARASALRAFDANCAVARLLSQAETELGSDARARRARGTERHVDAALLALAFEASARAFDVDIAVVRDGRGRDARSVAARNCAAWILIDNSGATIAAIARALGYADHTTLVRRSKPDDAMSKSAFEWIASRLDAAASDISTARKRRRPARERVSSKPAEGETANGGIGQ